MQGEVVTEGFLLSFFFPFFFRLVFAPRRDSTIRKHSSYGRGRNFETVLKKISATRRGPSGGKRTGSVTVNTARF